MYWAWFPKDCASIEQERTFHPCLRLQTPWDSVPLSLEEYISEAATLLCKSYLPAARILLCNSRSCQIVPKRVRASQCQGETSLHNSAKWARAHFCPQWRTIQGGREWRCDFCRNVQSCQGTGNSARETVGPPPASILSFCRQTIGWTQLSSTCSPAHSWHRVHIAVYRVSRWWSEVDVAKYPSKLGTFDRLHISLHLVAQAISRTPLSHTIRDKVHSEYLICARHQNQNSRKTNSRI